LTPKIAYAQVVSAVNEFDVGEKQAQKQDLTSVLRPKIKASV
jgi:hypothetical protein